MKPALLIIFMLFMFLGSLFSQEKSLNTSEFPFLTGPYLGQKPPGTTPELFSNGNIFAGSRNRGFSKNGDHFCLVNVIRKGNKEDYIDYHMQIKDGRWTAPVPLDFDLELPVRYPFFHPNGEKILFGSYVNKEKKKKYDMDICIADYNSGNISNMKILGPTVNTSAPERHPAVSKDGTLYFYSIRESGKGGADIYYSNFINGKYQQAQNIGDMINTIGDEYNPFIAPDGSYLMFNSYNWNGIETDHHDIYISFKNKDDSWTKAVNAGDKINSAYDEWAAYVTADGKYFFFTSRKHSKGGAPAIYWVSTRIIDRLKKTD